MLELSEPQRIPQNVWIKYKMSDLGFMTVWFLAGINACRHALFPVCLCNLYAFVSGLIVYQVNRSFDATPEFLGLFRFFIFLRIGLLPFWIFFYVVSAAFDS